MTELYKINGVQTLELLDRFYDDVFTGKKRNTWRYEEQPIEPGFLIFEASKDPSLLALVGVEDVMYLPLCDAYDILGGDVKSPSERLASMQTHYPDIQYDSEIMIVKHTSPSECYRDHGIPSDLTDIFGQDYIRKIESYD